MTYDLRPDQPRWLQIARTIRSRIESGEYGERRKITLRAITEEWGVAKGTAGKAVAQLRAWGLIYTVPDLGSFVGRPDSVDEDETP